MIIGSGAGLIILFVGEEVVATALYLWARCVTL